MSGKAPGRTWFRRLAARVAALGGEPGDDAPIPFADFDADLTAACGGRRRRGNERIQGPDEAVRLAVDRPQLVKWFTEDALGVQHDAEAPRAIRLATLHGMGDGVHAWVDPALHAAWVAGGAGAGLGIDPVGIDCRALSVDEIVVLHAAIGRETSRSSVRWHLRCTPLGIAGVAGRSAIRRLPHLAPDPSTGTADAIRSGPSAGLLERASRIADLF